MMITSANAPNMVNGQRYTPDRRKALYGGGAASGLVLGGAYGGRTYVKRRMERHRERITGKPTRVQYPDTHPDLLARIRQRLTGKPPVRKAYSHSIKPLWLRGYMKPGRTRVVLEKHTAALDKITRIYRHPAWKRARMGGLLGLGATGLAAGLMAAFPERRRR